MITLNRIQNLVFLLFLFLNATAQQNSVKFRHLSIDDGLSHNTVNCVYKDSRGFVWIGTNDGLNRYDGYDFKVYKNDYHDEFSLSNSSISCIIEDSKDNLWIGTRGGLNRFDRDRNLFHSFRHDPADNSSLGHSFVRKIMEDSRGNLWVGTWGGGLQIFDTTGNSFIRVIPANDIPEIQRQKNKFITGIVEDQEGRIWVTTHRPGINLYDPDSSSYSFFPFEPGARYTVKDNYSNNLISDKKGKLWITTNGDGCYLFDTETKTFEHFYYQPGENSLNNNMPRDVYITENNQYWIATDGGGINSYDPASGTFSFITYDVLKINGLSSNAIYCFYRDDTGILWIGTYGRGLNIYDPNYKKFAHYTHVGSVGNQLSHKAVLTFCEDRSGNIWIGTDGGGLNKFDPGTEQFMHYKSSDSDPNTISSNVVTSILEDSDRLLWIGTFARGLNKMDLNTGMVKHYLHDPDNPSSIANNNVWAILQNADGSLWVGTFGGLDHFDPSTEAFTHYYPYPGTENSFQNRIYVMVKDHLGQIWTGGEDLCVFNESTGEFIFLKDKSQLLREISDFNIRAIYEHKNRDMWIGTEGGGLICYSRGDQTFRQYSEKNGLPSNSVHRIVPDDNGNFWLSTNKGLSKFNPENETFKNYEVSDGLQSNQFSFGAGIRSSGGEIYMGGVNGFNVFHPDSIRDNTNIPDIAIINFYISNQLVKPGLNDSPLKTDICETSEITLRHDQTVISFDYRALNYTSSEKNQYKYIMEGFEEEWNEVGTRKEATYTNLDAGDYIFRVTGSNNDGIWNEQGTSVKITVLPPWWKTPFAFIIYTLVIFGLLYFFRRYSINRTQLKNDLRIKELERAKAEEINQMKLKFFTNVSHEFKTPLSLILAPLEKLNSKKGLDQATRRHLNTIQRNADRLLVLINQLMEFRKVEKGGMKLRVQEGDIVTFIRKVKEAFNDFARQHSIRYEFKSDYNSLSCWFDPDLIEKIFFNLLSNAFKFTSDNGSISVTLYLGRDNSLPPFSVDEIDPVLSTEAVDIVVEDTGVGIPPERIDKIFDPFYQISDEDGMQKAFESKGTGIGLALTRDLVTLHHGKIRVDSLEGKGSRFTVTIPMGREHFGVHELAEEPRTPPAVFTLDNQADLESERAEVSQDFSDGGEEQQAVPEKTTPVILIVEDNIELRNYLKSNLEPEYNILEAVNGSIGLRIALDKIPDLIIADIMMPEMDGLEMSAKLKDNNNTCHIPIIILTAKGAEESRVEGLETGVDDYINKPFSQKELEIKIRNLINIRKTLHEKFRKDIILEPSEVTVTSFDEKFLIKAMEIVEENISDGSFDVTRFVTEMGMSRSVLYRKLRAITNQSANEFINTIRLKRAAQLLSQNKLTVSEVTYQVGYNDPQYFSKCFSKFFGKSPSQYAADFKDKQPENKSTESLS